MLNEYDLYNAKKEAVAINRAYVSPLDAILAQPIPEQPIDNDTEDTGDIFNTLPQHLASVARSLSKGDIVNILIKNKDLLSDCDCNRLGVTQAQFRESVANVWADEKYPENL